MSTAALTERHRLAQARLGARTARMAVELWPLIDPEAVDDTFAHWLRAVSPVVQAQRVASSRLAANYLIAHKMTALGAGARTVPLLADPADVAALATSMLVTGPVRLKANVGGGVALGKAADVAMVSTARAAMRFALNGGRETITATAIADPDARGWQRVTSGRACDFCSILATDVYTAESADFQAHDGCTCSAEPAY